MISEKVHTLFEVVLDVQVNLMIDGLKLLGHDLVLEPELLHLLVLLDVHLPARLLPSSSRYLCIVVVVFKYFSFIIDCPEYFVVLIELSQFVSLILLDILQVIYRVFVHQGLFIRLRQFIILIFLFLIVFFLFLLFRLGLLE